MFVSGACIVIGLYGYNNTNDRCYRYEIDSVYTLVAGMIEI